MKVEDDERRFPIVVLSSFFAVMVIFVIVMGIVG